MRINGLETYSVSNGGLSDTILYFYRTYEKENKAIVLDKRLAHHRKLIYLETSSQ